MRIELIFILALVAAPMPGFAQKSKVVSALNYFNFYAKDKDAKNLKIAKTAIDQAASHPKSENMAKTWYYRGQIYYAIYSDEEMQKTEPNALIVAKEAFQRTVELDNKKLYADDLLQRIQALRNAFYAEGAAAFEAKDHEKAYQSFSNVLAINDFLNSWQGTNNLDTVVILYKAHAAEHTNRPDEAKLMYRQLVDLHYNNISIYQSLAQLLYTDSAYNDALEVVMKGRRLHPKDPNLMVSELYIYLAQDRLPEAIEKLEEAIQMEPENPELYFVLATAYDNIGEAKQARGNYEKSLALNPDYFDAIYNLGVLFYNQGIELNKQMNALTAKEQKKYDQLKAKRDELYNEALPYFEKAIVKKPNDLNTLYALKEIYALKGNLEKSNAAKKKLESLGEKL